MGKWHRAENSTSSANNNNVYKNCCCLRNNTAVDDLIEDDFVNVYQEPSTKSAARPMWSVAEVDTCEEAFEDVSLISSENVLSKIAYVHSVVCIDPGTYLHVRGRTNPGCTRFSVDFTCGVRSMIDGTIAFHFNPRLQEGYVVRNCLLAGYWGDEETTSPWPLALSANEPFELLFFVTPSEFNVSVNGRHFCAFRHRVQWERITSVEFVGDITINACVSKHANVYPFVPERKVDVYEIPINKEYADDVDDKLPMPFLGKITQILKVGSQIEICGKVKLLPHSFYVNLQCGLNIHPHAVIPLHLNPRFSASCGSNAFVRNAWVNGKWFPEERAPGFPFSPGYSFTLVIRIEPECYGIWVNGMLSAEYPYRVSNSNPVNAVYIQGDIYLRHISIQAQSRLTRYGFQEEVAAARL